MYLLRWLFYWFDLLIMMLWLEILGGHIHLSLQDPAGGQFWRNKPSLGFHGAWSRQVGCQGRTCRITMTCLWRLRGHLGGPCLALTCKAFCLERPKCHPWRVYVIIGARVWWRGCYLLTLGMTWWEAIAHEREALWAPTNSTFFSNGLLKGSKRHP